MRKCVSCLFIALGIALAPVTKAASPETVLYNFPLAPTGSAPMSALVTDARGNVYGTTSGGGQSGSGTVFEMIRPDKAGQAWTKIVLYNFGVHISEGGVPEAALVFDTSGALYGTTFGDDGTVFKLTPPKAGETAWTESELYRFGESRTDGHSPSSAVVFDRSGALYGTTNDGGLHNSGTVFKLVPPASTGAAWTESVLYNFSAPANGSYPRPALAIDESGVLYGVSGTGGQYGDGMVFSLSPPGNGQTAWTESVLHNFGADASDGRGPAAELVVAAGGALYGTTKFGGQHGDGTAFKLTPPPKGQAIWAETLLHSFQIGETDGGSPVAALVSDGGGSFYGTTSTRTASTETGSSVFKLTPPADGKAAWTERMLPTVSPNNQKLNSQYPIPAGTLVFDSSGNLYGTTQVGGLQHDGTVFQLVPPAGGETAWTDNRLFSFGGAKQGYCPAGPLSVDGNGALYGTTSEGQYGAGTVFRTIPPAKANGAWTWELLHSFAGGKDDGWIPTRSLVADAAGALYGETEAGGNADTTTPDGFGTAFKLTPPAGDKTAWSQTLIYRFGASKSDGIFPSANLVADESGAFYGTTEAGGTYSNGTVFKLTPPAKSNTAWIETQLYSFRGDIDGGAPAGLILDPTGVLYGVTTDGGQAGGEGQQHNYGTVFKLTPPAKGKTTWTKTALHSFQGGTADGEYPGEGLILDGSGALYGTTNSGGAGGVGTVFKLTPPGPGQTAWSEAVLRSFHNDTGDGADPNASLVFGNDGALYGTTPRGGASNDGTVFKLKPPATGKTIWSETLVQSFSGGDDGSDPFGGVITGTAGDLYGTTCYGGTGASGTVYRLTP